METTGVRFRIPIAKPDFAGDEHLALKDVLDSGWVSQGPKVQEFEQALCEYSGAKHAVAATSWTTAMHLGLLLYGVGTGHDVLCPSFSFIATANVIRYVGATPQFMDIDPATLNMDPDKTREFVEKHYYETVEGEWRHVQTGHILKGIQIVHQIGIPADIDAFAALAKKYNAMLFEDSACAIGSTYKNARIGGSGFPGAYSFHPRKVITTGEGGALLLNDEAMADRARILRTHGMSISDLKRHAMKSTVYESYNEVGYNYKMTDIQAALGLRQLDRLEGMVACRIDIANRYNEAFFPLRELELLRLPEYVTRWNVQSYPIRLKSERKADEAALETKRNRLMEALSDRGVTTRRGIPAAHREPAYHSRENLPVTDSVSRRTLFLPIYSSMTDDEVDYVIECVKASLKEVFLD